MLNLKELWGMVKGTPRINEPYYNMNVMGGLSQTTNSPVSYDVLYEYAQKTPEIFTPVQTIISDIISDGYYIQNYDGGSGRNKKKEAERWLRRNYFNCGIMQPMLWDALITGDFYLYIAKVQEEAILKKLKEVTSKLDVSDKNRAMNKLYQKYFLNYSFGSVDLKPLASSTMKIAVEENGKITSYTQEVAGRKEYFNAEEIIHGRYFTMNGKVYGFTPMKTILSEASILANQKDILGYSSENGGNPPFILTMEDESPITENYKLLVHQIRKYRELKNKNRVLLSTGKVGVTKMGIDPKDQMVTDILTHMGKLTMMVWGVPPSKMGMTGEKGSGYDSGLATEGYYKKISNLQEWAYELINWQFFIPMFGVEMKPNKAYLQDEVRETQVLMQKVQAGLQMWNNGWVNQDYITEKLLKLDDKYKGDFESKVIDNSELNQNMLPKEDMKPQAEKEVDDNRSQKQMENVANKVKSLAVSLDELNLRMKKSQDSMRDVYETTLYEMDKEVQNLKAFMEGYKGKVSEELRNEVEEMVDSKTEKLREITEKLEADLNEEEESTE